MRTFIELVLLAICRFSDWIFRPLGVPVLLYHSISDTPVHLAISATQFEAQLAYLKRKGYRSITPGKVFACAGAISKSVLITFDDGLRDNLITATPLLQKYGLSATLFVATDFIGRSASYSKYPAFQILPMVSAAEVTALEKAGWSIGTHGAAHINYPHLTNEEIVTDVKKAHAVLAPLLAHSEGLQYLALPRNKHDPRVREVVKSAGIRYAFAGGDRLAVHHSNPYAIPRISVHPSMSLRKFALLLSPTYHRLQSLWHPL